VELDTSYDEEPKFRTNKIPFPVMIKSPETILNGFSDNFVKTSLNGFIDTLFAGSFPDNGYRAMIDMDTFVHYIMIQEFMRNTDFWSLRSVYMYKDSATESKICMGPLWDFDNTLGNPNERIPDSGEDYTQLGKIFFGRFFDDLVFRARYKELWDAHYTVIANDMLAFIDTEAAKLADSYSMNFMAEDSLDYVSIGLGFGMDFPLPKSFFVRSEIIINYTFDSKVERDRRENAKDYNYDYLSAVFGPAVKLVLGYRF
jgi:hypothetical protein